MQVSDGGAQHISELLFDISGIPAQFEKIEKLLLEEGVRLKELAKSNWKLDVQVNNMAKAGNEQAASIAKVNQAYKEQIPLIDQLDKKQDGLIKTAGKWFGAYQLWHFAKRGATETIQTMKEVETSMMEISRVLNLTGEATDRLRENIFGIAGQMGREFGSTADIMLRFSQAGYDAAEATEMTKVALLAMNTAELDAQNSTNSMIGILQQWGYEADQLATIIDKLNYTADNNAATTQDLVDGLLRSSSAARNAKFSFDETVGALVALKEASGRSGREIGTALNSLISYTQRGQSLDVFESMGVTVWLDEQKTQLNSVINIWGELADIVAKSGESAFNTLEKQTDMTELYSEEVAMATNSMKEYNAMLEAENQLNQEGLNDAEKKKLYEQFGVYRRNYMIALLGNFAKVQEVVNEMQNAEGHSMRENARYMDTLEAKYQQLITSLKELAVQAGESGLMDLAKGALELATGLSDAAQAGGGLIPIMVTLAGVIALIKREKINQSITSALTSLGNAQLQLKLFTMEAKAAGSITSVLSANMAALGPGGAIGLAVGALGLLTMALTAYYKKQEEAREKAVETLNTYKDQADSIKNLRSEIQDETLSRDELVSLMASHNKKYEEELSAIDDVNAAREKSIELLGDEAKKKAEEVMRETGAQYSRQRDYLESNYTPIGGIVSTDTPEKVLESLGQEIDRLNEKRDSGIELSSAEERRLGVLEDQYSKLGDRIDQALSITTAYESAQSTLNGTLDESSSKIESVGDAVEESGQKASLSAEQYQELQDAISDYRSAISDIEGAMQALAEGKGLDIDATMDLIAKYPELAGAIRWVGDEYYFSADAMEAMRQAKYADILATQASIIATYDETGAISTLATEMSSAVSAAEKMAIAQQIVQAAESGTIHTTAQLTSAIQGMKLAMAGMNAPTGMKAGFDYKGAVAPKISGGGGGGGGQDPRIKELQSLQKETEKSYKAQEDAVKKRYDAEIEQLKRLKEELKRTDERNDYEKDRNELLAEREDMEKRTSREAVERIKEIDKAVADLDESEQRRQRDNLIDDQIAAIEARRDAEIEAIQAAAEIAKESYQMQIDALQAVANASGGAAGVAVDAAQAASDAWGNAAINMVESMEWFGIQAQNIFETTWNTAQQLTQGILGSLFSGGLTGNGSFSGASGGGGGGVRGTSMTAGTSVGGNAIRRDIKSSHTGSLVLSEGLVNLAPGEIVVREDISQGLLKIIERDKKSEGSVAGQKGGSGVVFNAPLMVIEKQVIEDHADARRGASDAGALLSQTIQSSLTKQ